MVSKRLTYSASARSLYPDSPQRRQAITRLRKKLESGEYRLEDVPCPCGHRNDELLATRDRFAIEISTVICRGCGLVRINPRMSEESYARFYAEDYLDLKTLERYENSEERVRAIHEDEYKAAARIYRFVLAASDDSLKLAQRKPRLADVGCGSGGMVRFFADQGWEAMGCDYDEGSVEYGRTRGLHLRVGGPAMLEAAAKFDLVILSHVLEHVTSPTEFVTQLAKILHPGGVLYIELPGILDISMRRYRNDFLRYLRFVHTFNFSLATLQNVVESRGFKLLRGDEWIHAAFVYEGSAPTEMRALPNEYRRIKSYLHTIAAQRRLYPAYWVYRHLRSGFSQLLRRA